MNLFDLVLAAQGATPKNHRVNVREGHEAEIVGFKETT